MAQYTMTLSGPKRVQLLGLTPAQAYPLAFVLGILGGMAAFLAKKGR